MGRLPGRNQCVQRHGVSAGLDLFAQHAVTQQLRNFRKDFKMFLCGGFGYQQKNQQIHSLLVRRVETDSRLQLENGSHRGFQALDAAMRNGHAMPEPGGAKTLAREQAVRDQSPIQTMLILEQQSSLFKRALFTRRFNADQDLGGGQNLRKTVHNDLLVAGLCTLQRVEQGN